jgi:hypothetical protein
MICVLCHLFLWLLQFLAVVIAETPAQYLILRIVPAVVPMATCGKQALQDAYKSDEILHRNEIIEAHLLTLTPTLSMTKVPQKAERRPRSLQLIICSGEVTQSKVYGRSVKIRRAKRGFRRRLFWDSI